MENYITPIFYIKDLLLKIMPYYSYTHNAFLLLSSLSKASRKNLEEFYEAFINWMKSNLMEVKINDDNIREKYSLPLDLFNFEIIIEDVEHAAYFKRLIEHINLIF